MLDTPEAETSLPTTSPGLVIDLSAEWRVVEDELQWILQYWRTPSWRSRSFCRSRSGLERCIREYCGPVRHVALLEIEALPEWHR